jgi:hypothetical protein
MLSPSEEKITSGLRIAVRSASHASQILSLLEPLADEEVLDDGDDLVAAQGVEARPPPARTPGARAGHRDRRTPVILLPKAFPGVAQLRQPKCPLLTETQFIGHVDETT